MFFSVKEKFDVVFFSTRALLLMSVFLGTISALAQDTFPFAHETCFHTCNLNWLTKNFSQCFGSLLVSGLFVGKGCSWLSFRSLFAFSTALSADLQSCSLEIILDQFFLFQAPFFPANSLFGNGTISAAHASVQTQGRSHSSTFECVFLLLFSNVESLL